MDSMLCCSFEAEIKGIMFYEGRSSLTPLTVLRVYFKKDLRNTFHSKVYFVHYSGNQNILGHLPWKEAEAVDDLFTIPTVKLSG